MKYIALLRGINVGGNHKVSMMKLKEVFHSLGYASISTYLNTGNVIFTSDQSQEHVQNQIQTCLLHLFSFEIPTLVKSQKEIQFIEQSVPQNWENNQEYKTDVGYLFPESDFPEILDDFDVNKQYITMQYARGAVFWTLKKEHYSKSRINAILKTLHYKNMTIRNINTTRHLAQI